MVTRHSANGFMPISDDGRWITHADYRAIEEEIAALRTVEGQWEVSHRNVCQEMESLRLKVRELVEASVSVSSVLARAMRSNGVSVHTAASAIKRVEDLAEALK